MEVHDKYYMVNFFVLGELYEVGYPAEMAVAHVFVCNLPKR